MRNEAHSVVTMRVYYDTASCGELIRVRRIVYCSSLRLNRRAHNRVRGPTSFFLSQNVDFGNLLEVLVQRWLTKAAENWGA